MNRLNNFIRILLSNPKILIILFLDRIAPVFPDKLFLHLEYWLRTGNVLNLKQPQTFSEKIQWLKLNDRKPEYTNMVDKVEVKQYVKTLIGEEYVIPTIAVYDKVEDIDWRTLPDSFVAKCSHDSGGLVICKDKRNLVVHDAVNKLSWALKRKYYYQNREWPYKNVVPRILIEPFMCDINQPELIDYKFYCFDGQPHFCQVIRDRQTKETIDFYDMTWQHLPFVGLNPKASNGLKDVPKPKKLDEMMKICNCLSSGLPFVRVDLYEINQRVYFGEMTFYPASGFGVFTPTEWNYKLGDLIKL